MAPTAVAVAGAGVGLEAVRSLASVADVQRLLHEASARERAIDTELEQLLSRRSELEQSLLQLHVSTEEVRTSGRAPTAPVALLHANMMSWLVCAWLLV
jgi:hypothetical protein